MRVHLRPWRKGFSLVELLVVIAIIGVLIGLLLPGVQKVRETAARVRCGNNLRQIGLALHGYHDIQGTFPPGSFNYVQQGINDRRCWFQAILPFLEQKDVYQVSLTFIQGGGQSYSAPDRWIRINNLMCPSDPAAGKNMNIIGNVMAASPQVFEAQGFHGNYLACAGSTVFNPPGDANGAKLNGIFYGKSKTRVADILDGTTNTLLVSESVVIPETSADLCPPLCPINTGEDWRGRYWASWAGESWFSTFYPPNTVVGDVLFRCRTMLHAPCQAFSSTNNIQSARSYHPRGVNAMLADGSVRYLSDRIVPVIYLALGTRASGEPAVDY